MRLIGVEMLLGFAVLAFWVPLILAIVDLARRPSEEWKASGHNQLVWALIVVFVGFLGPLLYLVIARPALNDAGQKVQTATNGA